MCVYCVCLCETHAHHRIGTQCRRACMHMSFFCVFLRVQVCVLVFCVWMIKNARDKTANHSYLKVGKTTPTHCDETLKLGSRRRLASSLAAKIAGSIGGRFIISCLQMSQVRSPLKLLHSMAHFRCLMASSPLHRHSRAMASPDVKSCVCVEIIRA